MPRATKLNVLIAALLAACAGEGRLRGFHESVGIGDGGSQDGAAPDGARGKGDADAGGASSSSGSLSGLALGVEQSCVFGVDGRSWCWGRNSFGMLNIAEEETESWTAVEASSGVKGLSVGVTHSCGVIGTRAHCWGNNEYGQLGRGTFSAQEGPGEVPNLLNVALVAVGDGFSCAVADPNRQLYCWGNSASDRLGLDGQTGEPIDSANPTAGSGVSAPSEVVGLDLVDDVALGTDHACVIRDDKVGCWGSGAYGKLGLGDTDNRATPGFADDPKRPLQVAVGINHTCVLGREFGGTSHITCWGRNDHGQLGAPASDHAEYTKRNLGPGARYRSPLVQIVSHASAKYTLARSESGAVYRWGSGNEGFSSDWHVVHYVKHLYGKVLSAGVGRNHLCFLMQDDRVLCQGRNTGYPVEVMGLPASPAPQ